MKNLLEIIMPASLTVVAGAIVLCSVMLGEQLTGTQDFSQDEPLVCGNEAVAMASFTDSVPADRPLPPGVDAAAVAAGDALFKGNCAQCHAVNEVIVGPALAGITKRRPMSWITSWVKNSSKLVASGDDYAVKIFEQYQKQQMPSFQLSEKEIQQIVSYIDSQEGVAQAGTDAVAYAPGTIVSYR
ncbi:c-type cytochrome [Hymenobacter pini]|uniref:c-type cytochrome n=1 Tax=Hymenobacter pini TaxID=2880879 RepID=UPI001CF38546|nr:cytochrome c [Hymenobacter pini]MCA8830887.1 cytochrome c [Hymenobacter pini]